jgi:hypothetical protein
MMDENKKMEVVFAPGCFDDFQGTPEELAELIAKIHKMADSGEIFENARPLSEEEAAEFLAKQTQTRQ